MLCHQQTATPQAASLRRKFHEPPRLNVLLTGPHGLIGGALTAFLEAGGHRVYALARGAGNHPHGASWWDPEAGRIWLNPDQPLNAVVHLAGENIAGRWTAHKKRRIQVSRVQGTRLLCEELANMIPPPSVLVSASGLGYYGNRGEEVLTEESPAGSGFLAEVTMAWEAAAAPAIKAGIRVVLPRLGMVLARHGGALANLLPHFKMGLGGPMGDGRQFWSWITLDDVIGVIYQALMDEVWRGPINACAPGTTTNREFARTLGTVLRRPAFLPAPALLLRALLGEMAVALLLSSQNARPQKLLAGGFQFSWPVLGTALRNLLGCPQAVDAD